MAIVQMQKFHVLTFQENQEQVLQGLQNFQKAEILAADEDLHGLNTHFTKENASAKTEELENQLARVVWARDFLKNYLPKESFLQGLRRPPKSFTLPQLAQLTATSSWETFVEDLRLSDRRLRLLDQEKQDLSKEEDELNRWRYFDESPAVLKTLKHSIGILGTISNEQMTQLSQELEKFPSTYYQIIQQTTTTTYVFLLFHKSKQKPIERALIMTGFSEYEYLFEGKPADALSQVKEKRLAVVNEEKALKESLQKMTKEAETLGLVAEHLSSAIIKSQNQEKILHSKSILNVSGWVPIEEATNFEAVLQRTTKGNYYLVFEEVKEEEIKEVPILLKNHRLVAPFEALIEMYSLPRYDEIDPTPFMAPFYALAFGMMVADFGYGLLLFLGIFLIKRLFHFEAGMKRNLDFFQICAVPTMMWGLLYGSLFGFTMPLQVLSSQSDITEILLISVIFGFIQVFFALILKFYLLWSKQQQKFRAIFQAGSWMLFLLSGALMAVGMMLLPDTPLGTIGLSGLILSLVAVLIGGSVDGNTFVGKIGTALYSLMDLTNYMSDLVSYTRLMALGVAGGSIAAAFNLIISYFPPAIRFTFGIVLFILLHSINIFLSYLGAYVHGIRLQYLEFFGKFFTGGGRAFNPLKASEKYASVKIEEVKTQEELD
ncbi:V-type ATP synthase subunit I [Enterococcus sp. LJL98]